MLIKFLFGGLNLTIYEIKKYFELLLKQLSHAEDANCEEIDWNIHYMVPYNCLRLIFEVLNGKITASFFEKTLDLIELVLLIIFLLV